MKKAISVFFLVAVLCSSVFHLAQGLHCYRCDSNTALVNCTKVQKMVTCDSGVKECCTLSVTGTTYSGFKYKYFGKGCKGRKHQDPPLVSVIFNNQCCGKSLCNTSCISQASFVLVSCLILVVSKIN